MFPLTIIFVNYILHIKDPKDMLVYNGHMELNLFGIYCLTVQ